MKVPNGHWSDWENIESALRSLMKENHGLIPGRSEFRSAGLLGLLQGINIYHGGLMEARKRLGVHGKKYCSGCQSVKEYEDFRMRIKTKNGVRSESFRDNICKNCSTQKSQEYRKTRKGIAAELYRRAKGRAANRNLDFDISKEWIFDRLEEIRWRCEVTACEFQDGVGDGFMSHFSASIDRIDSSRGYTRDNVQFVINWVNIAKSNLHLDDFKKMCAMVNE